MVQYFYDGMCQKDKDRVDAAAGGALQDVTPTLAKLLLQTMADNCQNNTSSERNSIPSTLNAINVEQKLTEISNMLHNLSAGTMMTMGAPEQVALVCGICLQSNHQTITPTISITINSSTTTTK